MFVFGDVAMLSLVLCNSGRWWGVQETPEFQHFPSKFCEKRADSLQAIRAAAELWLSLAKCRCRPHFSDLIRNCWKRLLINKIQLKWSRFWSWLPAVTDLTCGHLLLLPIGRLILSARLHPAALTFELSWGFSSASEHCFTSRSDLQDKSSDWRFFHRHCKQVFTKLAFWYKPFKKHFSDFICRF